MSACAAQGSMLLSLIGLPALAAASSTGAFLEPTGTQSTTSTTTPTASASISAAPSPATMAAAAWAPEVKVLDSAVAYADQLAFAVADGEYCSSKEIYQVSDGVYGLIRGPLAEGEDFLYPSDKAVSWLSDHAFLASTVNQKDLCCSAGADAAQGMTQCLCKVATSVQIDRVDGWYEMVAVDTSAAQVTPISPRWANEHFHSAVVESYAWVFGDVNLAVPFEELQATCLPSPDTWAQLESFNTHGPGLKAYAAIMANPDYGIGEGGQMQQLKCEPLNTQTGEGGCGCLGKKDGHPYCQTDTDVVLFCGSGGTESCDPRPFLCPEDGTVPVGYLRAYLHKFFDAIPFFHGTGFADEDGKVPEFIVSPNMRADAQGVARAASQELFGSCAA